MRGSGSSEGQSPSGKDASLPAGFQLRKSVLVKIVAALVENRHSFRSAVCHAGAADGSFPLPLTIGLFPGLVQLTSSASFCRSAGTASTKF